MKITQEMIEFGVALLLSTGLLLSFNVMFKPLLGIMLAILSLPNIVIGQLLNIIPIFMR